MDCRAYPDEKGIETYKDVLEKLDGVSIAEPIPMKRELKLSSWSEKFLPEITPVMSGPMVSEFWREAANAEERVDIIIYP